MPPQQPIPETQLIPKKGHGLLVPFILLVLLFIGVCGFAIWAFAERTDYKHNVDQKVDAAVTVAVQEESTRKDTEFIEREKEPTKLFSGPNSYGSVSFKFPKTWSGYVIEKDKAKEQLNAFFHPGLVPSIQGQTAFALRMQVVDRSYAETVKGFAGKVKTGKIKSTSYKAKNVEGIVGVRLVGEINREQKDTMIVLPLRDKTLKVWTETDDFVKDLDKFVLESLTFSP